MKLENPEETHTEMGRTWIEALQRQDQTSGGNNAHCGTMLPDFDTDTNILKIPNLND